MCALIVQTQIISYLVIYKQLTYVNSSTTAFDYVKQRSFDSDHLKTIFSYLLKTANLFCGIM